MAEAALPHRPAADSADVEEVRAFTRDQLATFLAVVHPRYRLAFELLATTGLRWSEFAALRWADLALDGEHPALAVRRAGVRGADGPPKSRHGRRDVPLTWALADKLRAARKASEWPRDGDLVFASLRGSPLDHADVMRRVLRPAAAEAGAPWAGFHTFRHTCATLMFARGANAVQVQRRLGHHSASFTLDTYVHLLPDDPGDPVDLGVELAQGGQGAGWEQPPSATATSTRQPGRPEREQHGRARHAHR
jgi:integrase